ncbi:transglutaminase domain-containing protein [Hymenobacter sp. PAMC 26628]|uniref:transglutaminase domain-containing protein n=1 Tax=Hymenobacter sp. PAMC 26628 TaxID=1484118 RepID=UPI00138F2896|nr:transglutaminase domain-containing protein [Hymenobacter sp. PAMC 26628]
MAAHAQTEPVKFGQIDAKDLTAAPFVADSAAGAVVLCDYGRSRLVGYRDGFRVVFERVTRVKILKKSGYDAATVEIPLYHRDGDQEEITNLRGFTYNLVGGQVQKTKLDATGVFLEKRSPRINVRRFTLPSVREGAVVEYAYTLSSDFLFNFQNWVFQGPYPVRWSEYRTSIPVFYKYKIIRQGGQPLAVDRSTVGKTTLLVDNKLASSSLSVGQTNGSLTVSAPTEEYQWAMQNVPPLREEAYTTTAADYEARIDFQLVGEQWPEQPYRDLTDSWAKINARLLADDNFGQQLERGGFLKDQMGALAAQYPDPAARAAAVRQTIMAAVRYNGTNRYATEASLRKAYDAHSGTAADVNLLLIAALRQAGLPAQPVLLSTRGHGRVSQTYPLLDKFNYVVALVTDADGHDLLVDATDPALPCGTLPERCLNQTGRLIAPGPGAADGRWVDLRPSQRHAHFRQARLTLDAQGGLAGQVHEEYAGYAGADAREELARLGEKKYAAQLAHQHAAWALAPLAVGARDDVQKPLALDYAFTRAADDGAPAGTLYLSPLREFLDGQNPFTQEDRSFPVDFGAPQEETLLVALTLPAGYELAETPKNAIIDLPDSGGRYLFNVATIGSTVNFTSRLALRKPVYSAAEYTHLREFYRLMLEKQAEKLVIKKKA